jgi:hypothetical protein
MRISRRRDDTPDGGGQLFVESLSQAEGEYIEYTSIEEGCLCMLLSSV